MKLDASKSVLPVWAEKLRQVFLAGESSVFILYGNVQDYVWYEDALLPMTEFWSRWMAGVPKGVLEWSAYQGLRQVIWDGSTKTIRYETKQHSNTPILDKINSVDVALKLATSGKASTILVPHTTALIPSGDPQYRSADERMLVSAVQDWSMDRQINQSDSMLVLFADSLSSVPAELLANPRIATVEIGLPDEALRKVVIQDVSSRKDPSDEGIQKIAQHTAGLKLIQIASIFGREKGLSREDREALIRELLLQTTIAGPVLEERVRKLADITGSMTPDEIYGLVGTSPKTSEVDAEVLAALMTRKKTLIEKECSGLIEFMDTKHGLSSVGGNANIKDELMNIANILKSGKKHLAPMGLLAVGAMGAGKTFVIKAFLKEAGLTGLTLKNFRSKWVGSTESNLEKVLATVKAMGPVALVIDESDRSFGNGGGEGEGGDGGTSSRIIARLKEFMSDPENRGQVLFIMMTNRPDKLDTDIKRPGRLDRKIPFFYADNVDDIRDIAKVLCKRYDVDASPLNDDSLVTPLIGYSNADIEALVGLYANLQATQPEAVALDLFVQAQQDFIPPREKNMIHFMNLLAVKEASRKSLVPSSFHYLYEDNALDEAINSVKFKL